MIRAGLILLLGAGPAAAQEAEITCAALWTGYADFARISAYLNIGDAAAQAAMFRKAAITAGMPPKAADREIDAQRYGMALLVRATVEGGDRASRDLFERQMKLCDRLTPMSAQ